MPGTDLYSTQENVLPTNKIMEVGSPKASGPINFFIDSGERRASFLPPLPPEDEQIAATVTNKELYDNRRFGLYDRTKTEEDYAYGQSALDKAGNGIAKLAGTTASTIVNNTFGLLYGMGSAIVNQKFASLYDNDFYRKMDTMSDEMRNAFPHYYTEAEKKNPLALSSVFTGNFLWDKIVSNLGYAVGSAVTAYGATAALEALQLSKGLMAAGRGLQALEATEAGLAEGRGIAGVVQALKNPRSVAGKLGRGLEALGTIEEGAKASKATQLLSSYLGVSGEAGMESFQNAKEFRENAINVFKEKNDGREPTGKDLQDIEAATKSVGNWSYGLNVALLTGTEYVQLPKIFGSTYAGDKKILNNAVFKDNLWKSTLPEKGFGKFLYKTGKVGSLFFNTAEGFEEGAQYAIQTGTQNFFDKKNRTPEQTNFWNSLGGLLMPGGEGVMGFGAGKALTEDEGLENILLGGLSGALMTSGVVGMRQNEKGETVPAFFKTGKIGERGFTGYGGERGKFTEEATSAINSAKLTDLIDSVNRAMGINEDRDKVLRQGDILESKDKETDYMLNYLLPRIKYGGEAIFNTELDAIRQKAATADGFMELQAAGTANENDTPEAFIARTNNIQAMAERVTENYDKFKTKYAGLAKTNEDGSPQLDAEGNLQRKYDDLTIDKMVYTVSKIFDYNDRIPKLVNKLTFSNVSVTDILSEINLTGNATVESVETALEAINKLNEIDAVKNDLRTNLQDVMELSLRRNNFINEFNKLEKNPDSFTEAKDETTPEKEVIKTEDGTVVPQFTNNKGQQEEIKVGREYQIPAFKKAKVDKIDGEDRWQVTSPDGSITFYKTEERAKKAAEDLDSSFGSLGKVKITNINPNGTVEIEDSNGNTQTVGFDRLSGYEKIQTRQEQLLKFAEEVEKEQQDIEGDSGVVSTRNNFDDITEMVAVPWEDKKKATRLLFTSSTTESEGSDTWAAETESAPHITRAREFFSNAAFFANRNDIYSILVTKNNEDALGLTGLTNLSLKGNLENATSLKNGFVAQVFIQYKNGKREFVDKNGQPITEGDILDQVVFQTMPTTSLTNKDPQGNEYNLYRKGQKEEAEVEQKRYASFREVLFADTSANPNMYKFNISRGIPVENVVEVRDDSGNVIEFKYEKNSVVETLLPANAEELINTQQGLITISTDGSIIHHGETVKIPKGRPVFQYGDTMLPVWNAQFNSSEATSVYEVLKKVGEGINDLSKMKPYTTFLKHVLYWKRPKLGEDKSQNQVYIDSTNMILHLGTQSYEISELPILEKEITNHIKTIFANVNNDGLTKNFSSPFREFYFENGELKNREWYNYQTFLLDNKNPDGSSRSINDTPLSTSVAKRTDAIPFNFKQRYSTLSDVDMPNAEVVVKTPTAEIVPVPTEAKTYTFPSGKSVQYTSTIVNGKIYVNPATGVLDGELVTATANDPAKVANFKSTLEDTEGLTNEEIVKAALAITLNDLLNRETTAATVTQTTPYGTEVAPAVTTSTESIDIETKYDSNNTSAPQDQYRKVGYKEQGKETITDVDIATFRDYIANVAPNIPYEFVDNYINVVGTSEQAYGVFSDAIIKVFKGAIKGTEYHELMEGVWNGFLTPDEQQAIIDEFKSNTGKFTDRETGKKIAYADATNLQAKERVMDNFSDFRAGKIPAKSFSERVLRFFKAIIDWFKNLVVKDKLQKDLFKKVEAGAFKEFKFNESVKYATPQYRKIEKLTYKQANLFVQDMVVRIGQIMLNKKKSDIYNPNAITSIDVINEVEQLYIAEGKRQELGDNVWEQLVRRTKDKLRSLLGIQFNDEVEDVVNKEGANSRDYAKDPFDIDLKSNSFGIRLAIGTLPLVTGKKIPGVLPERQLSTEEGVKGFKLLEFDRAFATLLDRLSNTTSVYKAIDKLVELADQDPTYVRVFKNIGGDPTTMTINFDSFKDGDWKLFIDFIGTFTRMKPDVAIQYVNGNEVFIGEANLFNAVRNLTDTWINNMRDLSRDKSSYIRYEKESGTYEANDALFTDTNIESIDGRIKFLNDLGITFSMEVYNKLNDKNKAKIEDQAKKLFIYLKDVGGFVTLSRDVLNVKNRLNTIAEIYIKATNPLVDTTYEGIDGKTRQAYALNNAVSLFANQFNEASSLEELKTVRPELNDVFSTNSLTLKQGGLYFDRKGKRIDGAKLNIGVIGGTFNKYTDKGVASVKLNRGARFTQEFNENIVGKYYVINPADANSEWELNLRNHIQFDDIQGDFAWSNIYTIFNGYLQDDISLALDADNRSNLKNVGKKQKELRFFKDILASKPEVLERLNLLITNGVIREQIDAEVKTYQEDINEAIKTYLDGVNARLFNTLVETSQVFLVSGDTYSFAGLLSEFAEKNELNKNNISKQNLLDVVSYVGFNKTIALIEYHKVLIGDPLQFKIKEEKGVITLDETKRLKSWQSPRKTTFDIVEFRNYHNIEYNKTGLPGQENRISLSPDDVGYSAFEQFVNTSTIEDVEVVGSLVKYLKTYVDVNESDANSIISDVMFRQVKLRNAQWSPEAEAFHQWQMAYTRKQLAKKKVYDKKVYDYKENLALKEHDEKLTSTPAPMFKLEVLKPIATGNKYGKNYFDQILDKFSQMPLYYGAVEGKGLEDVYIKMWKEKRGYIIAESGRKVGTEERHKLYNGNVINKEPFNNLVKVPWSAYGIQVENEYNDANGEVTSGSQTTKLISVNLYNNGVPISSTAERYYKRNTDALRAILNNGFNSYLDKMGLEDIGINYKIVDKKKLAESLEFIMLQREVDDNVRDTIQLNDQNEFLIPFEASPAYQQIRDIIYSILDKSIVSRKTSGGAYVQVPVTGWENAKLGRRLARKTDTGYEFITSAEYDTLSKEEKAKVVLTDDTLKAPSEEDPYMEILIPNWFKVKLGVGSKFADEAALLKHLNGTKEGQRILKGIAFRIPTQAPSSIDAVRAKGFLPQYMGKTVVVPSEITKKTNSDFDIDKLNIYLKSIYKDKNGDIRLIEYKGSEEATKEFYANVFDEVLETKKIKKANLLEAAQILAYELEDPKNLVDRYSNLLDVLLDGVSDSANFEDAIVSQLEELGDANIQAELKEKFIKTSYKKALENEYYESLEEIMSLRETFIQRITPVDDAGLEDLANEIDELRGVTESNIPNRILDGVYLTNVRHNMAMAKAWVGRAAMNITIQSMTQKGRVIISPERIEGLEDDVDKNFLGNGKMLLPYKPLTINGVDHISISNTTDTDGKYISDVLSGYGTAFVDVANKPFIVKIIKNDLAVNAFLFLSRATVSKETVAKFMSQPIIDEYLTMLDNTGATNLYGKTNINTIKQEFPAPQNLIDQMETLDVDEFDANIEKYYKRKEKFNDTENAKQHFILNEFLKYAKMADYAFQVTQALNYDTTSFKSGDILFQKQLKTQKAIESNIFVGVEGVLKNTFLGDQASLLDDAFSATGEILILEKDELRNITDKLLTPYAIKKYLSKDNFSKIGNKIKLSFLDFIIQTKSSLSNEIETLLVNGETAAVNQLAVAKKNYPNLPILNELEQVASPRKNGTKTIKLRVNLRNNPNTINLYTDYMRELRENPDTNELFNNLVKVSILQGLYKSPLSILPIIPVESYSEVVSPLVSGLTYDSSLEVFSKGAFERNNFRNNDIFYQFEPKFFGSRYDPMTDEPTYYTAKAYFPVTGGFNVLPEDRKILTLSEKWNYVATRYNFVKFPRVITETRKGSPTGTYIDVTTGKPISERGLTIMRANGDLSASDILGYQKVTDGDGNPLLIQENGEVKHVYKMINLYGDGDLTNEYYLDFRPSVLNNGTVKVNEEIPDEDIIRHYLDKNLVVLKENNVSLLQKSTQSIPVAPDVEFVVNGNSYYMRPDGNIIYGNGNLVKDPVIINQVNARQQIQDGNIKIAVFNGVNYFVLDNGKIIDATKENFGKEPQLPEATKEIILAKAVTYKKNC
jgi:hypothetical protein